MPQVVEAASAPMASIDKLTVISTDGAASLTKTVAANVAQGLQLGSDLTGIDLTALLARLGGGAMSTSDNGDKPALAPSSGQRRHPGPGASGPELYWKTTLCRCPSSRTEQPATERSGNAVTARHPRFPATSAVRPASQFSDGLFQAPCRFGLFNPGAAVQPGQDRD